MPRKAKSEIVDTVTTGPAPMGQSNEARKTSHLRADPRYEYVASGPNPWLATYLRSLPQYIDDVTRDFGADLYDRMLNDPQVESCVEVLKTAIIANGVRLTAAVEDDNPDYEQAMDIRNFCERNLDTVVIPAVLYDLLDAVAFGNRIAEQVYTDGTGVDDGKLVLAALKVKPRDSYAFVVDAYQNCVGIIGRVPGRGMPVLTNILAEDPERFPGLLPRSKFAVLSYRPKAGDPRGTSILRPAYNAWWLKMQAWGEYLKYITQFAGPSLVHYLAENAIAAPLTDANGNVQTDASGNPIMVDPTQAALAALQAFRNGTAAVFPFGSKTEPLQMQGEGAPFLSFIDLLDRQIAKAILGQTLATEEAQHQARAASEVHQDVMGLIVSQGKTTCAAMVARDILRPLVRYNYGAEALPLVPQVSLSETEQQDFATTANAVAALMSAGYIDRSQMQALDALLNLPTRADDWQERGGDGDEKQTGADSE